MKLRIIKLLPPLALAALGLLYYASFADTGIVLNDEGILTSGALRLEEGFDSFLSSPRLYPPGRYLYAWAMFKLFGWKLIVLKHGWMVLRILTALAIYVSGTIIMPRRYAFGAALFSILVPGHWHKTFFQFFPAVNLCIALFMLRVPDRCILLSAISGAWTGVAFFFRQDIAFFQAVVTLTAGIIPLLSPEFTGKKQFLMKASVRFLVFAAAACSVFLVEALFFREIWTDWIFRLYNIMSSP